MRRSAHLEEREGDEKNPKGRQRKKELKQAWRKIQTRKEVKSRQKKKNEK